MALRSENTYLVFCWRLLMLSSFTVKSIECFILQKKIIPPRQWCSLWRPHVFVESCLCGDNWHSAPVLQGCVCWPFWNSFHNMRTFFLIGAVKWKILLGSHDWVLPYSLFLTLLRAACELGVLEVCWKLSVVDSSGCSQENAVGDLAKFSKIVSLPPLTYT